MGVHPNLHLSVSSSPARGGEGAQLNQSGILRRTRRQRERHQHAAVARVGRRAAGEVVVFFVAVILPAVGARERRSPGRRGGGRGSCGLLGSPTAQGVLRTGRGAICGGLPSECGVTGGGICRTGWHAVFAHTVAEPL